MNSAPHKRVCFLRRRGVKTGRDAVEVAQAVGMAPLIGSGWGFHVCIGLEAEHARHSNTWKITALYRTVGVLLLAMFVNFEASAGPIIESVLE